MRRGPIWRSHNERRDVVLCKCLVLFYGALYWKSICDVRVFNVRGKLLDDWCEGRDEVERGGIEVIGRSVIVCGCFYGACGGVGDFNIGTWKFLKIASFRFFWCGLEAE